MKTLTPVGVARMIVRGFRSTYNSDERIEVLAVDLMDAAMSRSVDADQAISAMEENKARMDSEWLSNLSDELEGLSEG